MLKTMCMNMDIYTYSLTCRTAVLMINLLVIGDLLKVAGVPYRKIIQACEENEGVVAIDINTGKCPDVFPRYTKIGHCCVKCTECQPGEHKYNQDDICTSTCVPCPQGTFSNMAVGTHKCLHCVPCRAINRFTLRNCTPTENSQCGGCFEGFKSSSRSNNNRSVCNKINTKFDNYHAQTTDTYFAQMTITQIQPFTTAPIMTGWLGSPTTNMWMIVTVSLLLCVVLVVVCCVCIRRPDQETKTKEESTALTTDETERETCLQFREQQEISSNVNAFPPSEQRPDNFGVGPENEIDNNPPLGDDFPQQETARSNETGNLTLCQFQLNNDFLGGQDRSPQNQEDRAADPHSMPNLYMESISIAMGHNSTHGEDKNLTRSSSELHTTFYDPKKYMKCGGSSSAYKDDPNYQLKESSEDRSDQNSLESLSSISQKKSNSKQSLNIIENMNPEENLKWMKEKLKNMKLSAVPEKVKIAVIENLEKNVNPDDVKGKREFLIACGVDQRQASMNRNGHNTIALLENMDVSFSKVADAIYNIGRNGFLSDLVKEINECPEYCC